jgi:hypothetical protein
MSGLPNRKPSDSEKFRKEYLATLALQARNDAINYEANKVYQRTGAPAQPTDTRNTTEKLADLNRLRIEIRSRLGEIMSGDDATRVVESLDAEEAQFVAQQIQSIIADLKPKYALGVPSQIFIQYLNRLMEKFERTQGVDFGIQQATGDRLLVNQNFILDNLPSTQQIDTIFANIRQLGYSNTAIGRRVEENLAEIREAMSLIPQAFRTTAVTENFIMKDELLRQINDLVRELPTNTQLQNLMADLEIARNRRDQVLAEGIMRQIAVITEYAGDIQQEMAMIRQTMKESKIDEIPEAEASVTEQTGMIQQATVIGREPKIKINGVEYGYLEESILNSLPAVPKTGVVRANLEDYINALRQINPDVVSGKIEEGGLGLTKSKEARSKAYRLEMLREGDPVVQELWRNAEPQPEISGKGFTGMDPHKKLFSAPKMPRITGKGVSSNKVIVDDTAGIKAEADYVPFGKFIINRKKLAEGIFMIKRRNGQFLADVKSKRISPNLTTVFKKMAGGSLPAFGELERLDDDEREYLRFVSNKSSLASKFDVPSPKKDKNEMLINQFEILRGQLIAGNDSKDLVKKFKKVLLEMVENDLLPKGQTREILIELAKID